MQYTVHSWNYSIPQLSVWRRLILRYQEVHRWGVISLIHPQSQVSQKHYTSFKCIIVMRYMDLLSTVCCRFCCTCVLHCTTLYFPLPPLYLNVQHDCFWLGNYIIWRSFSSSDDVNVSRWCHRFQSLFPFHRCRDTLKHSERCWRLFIQYTCSL